GYIHTVVARNKITFFDFNELKMLTVTNGYT
ncbi:hypothetical protein LCGC14_0898850, partial [marine sediment metagenome]